MGEAILAGIHVLSGAEAARAYAGRRPDPRVPNAIVERIVSAGDESSQRAAGIAVAAETIERLSAIPGLRGFGISADREEDALELIDKAGLRTE
jgi:hypothetical protein